MVQVMKSRDTAEKPQEHIHRAMGPLGILCWSLPEYSWRVASTNRPHGLNGPSRTESVEPNKVVKIRSEGCEIPEVPNVPHQGPRRVAEESHPHKAASELSGPGHEKSGHRGKATRTHSQGYGTLGDSLLEHPQSTRGGSSAQIGLRTEWSKSHGVGRAQ